jgi:ATP-dependent DNA ligase
MLPFQPPLEPMLAQAQDDIPQGEEWVYEPKWDGFRAIVFKDGDFLHLCSRNGQPLERYFPEVVEGLKRALPPSMVVDGEIILPGPKGLDFEALGSRIHPAASRINRLAQETPAGFVAFDCLALADVDLRPMTGTIRREKLLGHFQGHDAFFVTPQTASATEAQRWFHDFEGAGCDGVIARRAALDYQSGKRVMIKVKHGRTVDCVVGAYRPGKTEGTVGSLLLGLYSDDGVFHHVGHTSSFTAKEKKALREKLAPLEGGTSFGQGRTPDAPSRWSKGKEGPTWVALQPTLVCEVRYDYLQGNRFRHAATFLRWREDKAPTACSFSQLLPPNPFSLASIVALSPGRVAST